MNFTARTASSWLTSLCRNLPFRFAFAVAVALSGCRHGTQSSNEAEPSRQLQASGSQAARRLKHAEATLKQTPETGKRVERASAAQVSVRIADQPTYREVLRRLRGKIVLVDFWATWCLPCLQHFPETIQLYQKYSANGLALVTVSLDDPDESGTNPAVLEFLSQQNATCTNLISKYGTTEKSFQVFDISGGAIPHYKLYDRSGTLIAAFGSDDPDRPLNLAEVEAAIREALGLEQ